MNPPRLRVRHVTLGSTWRWWRLRVQTWNTLDVLLDRHARGLRDEIGMTPAVVARAAPIRVIRFCSGNHALVLQVRRPPRPLP